MKKTPLFLLTALLLTVRCIQAQQRPNIIVFPVDDMGWMDTSVPFGNRTYSLNKRYRTPNMERLASEGVKFTNAMARRYAHPAAAACSRA